MEKRLQTTLKSSASPLVCFVVCFAVLFFSEISFSEELPTNEPLLPLPLQQKNLDPKKIELGKKLFEEKALSKDSTVSCASCHNLLHGGVDGMARSVGINGALGDINAPTVFNSGFNFRQFWNGRAKTLEDQVDGPIQHAKEMGATWEQVISNLNEKKYYLLAFKETYKDGVTRDNIKDALATFERSLVTADSRFDQFLRGNQNAISEIEKNGYKQFKAYGCIACHQGVNVGGNMYQAMGVMGNYFKDRGTPITDADLGRFAITKDPADKYVFRVPSLRNVELTAPYFHDGSVNNLEDAVGVMVKYQLGRKVSKKDISAIASFLRTLTGKLPDVVRSPAGEAK